MIMEGYGPMVRRRSGRTDNWLDTLDPLARHPVLAALSGLAMVVLLVPVLSFVHGADGLLGQSIPLFFIVPVVISAVGGGRLVGQLATAARRRTEAALYDLSLSLITQEDHAAVLSARGEESTKVRALLRRPISVPLVGGSVRVGALAIDLDRRQVEREATTLDLTAREFDVLAYLAR